MAAVKVQLTAAARRDEAYATPYLIPSPLVHSTSPVLKGVDIMP